MFEAIINNIQGIVVFIVFLGILISVHEWGHFITAKKLGVQVDEFALGFGPTLFSKTMDGTLYSLKLFPLGGFVRMAGDERSKVTGDPREFYSKPIGQRALVVLNGPLINFVLAYVCLWVVFIIGYPEVSPKVGKLLENYPGVEAGLMVGDKINQVNGRDVESWSDLQALISESKGDTIDLSIGRGEENISIVIRPKIEQAKNIFGEMAERRLVGIIPSEEIISLTYDPLTSIAKAAEKFWYFTAVTYKAIYSMATGAMSAKENMGGPVFIFTIVKNAAEMGFNHFIFLLGVISLNLAIFNLLPIIPLDGGHLFLFAVEKVRGKPLPEKVDIWVSNVGFSMIILLALFIFYVDFERIGLFDKIRNIFS